MVCLVLIVVVCFSVMKLVLYFRFGLYGVLLLMGRSRDCSVLLFMVGLMIGMEGVNVLVGVDCVVGVIGLGLFF